MIIFFISAWLILINCSVIYIDNNLIDTNVNSEIPDCTTYNPTTFSCGGGTDNAYTSMLDINKFLESCTIEEPVEILFRRGQVWVFTSNNDCLYVKKSHVTIKDFGDPNEKRPVLDGDNKYPGSLLANGIPTGVAIKVHSNSAVYAITDVKILNIEIRNLFPGGAIIFNGEGGGYSNTYEGSGLIKNVYIHHVGWGGISLLRIANSSVLIDSCEIGYTGLYPQHLFQTQGLTIPPGWPQTINTNNGKTCCGNILRNSYIHHVFAEGVGSSGFSLVENNIIQDASSVGIYHETSSGGFNLHTIIRYNLVFGTSEKAFLQFGNHMGIRVNDEKQSGSNEGITIDIYGNIVINTYDGIGLRNHPTDGTTISNFGKIRIFNNLMINNVHNIHGGHSERFNDVEVKNNLMLIYEDDCEECRQASFWSGTPDNWIFQSNHYFPEPVEEKAKSATDEYSDPNLPKKNGWNSLTDFYNFKFEDLIPPSASSAVDNSKVIQTIFNVLLTRGTNFNEMPPRIVLAEQNSVWDYGAILRDGKIVKEEGGGDNWADDDNSSVVKILVGVLSGSFALIILLSILIIFIICVFVGLKKKRRYAQGLIRSEIDTTELGSTSEIEENVTSKL